MNTDRDWAGRAQSAVTAEGFDQQFGVDVRAGAVLIAELSELASSLVSDAGRRVTGNVIRMG